MPNPSELERMRQENKDEMQRVSGHQPMRDEGDLIMASPKTPEQQLADLDEEMKEFDGGEAKWPAVGEFERKLEALINEQSMEAAGGDTPDFILARFLRLQLEVFHSTVRRRAHWYGEREGLVR